MSLNDGHEHTAACVVTVTPLAIVEVFNSQGCVSCPPALPSIYKMVLANPNALLLTYNVAYWSVDLFSSPTARYALGLSSLNVAFASLDALTRYRDNRSGWKDTFAQSQWDQRQKAYASRWGKEGVFTPQVVLDGLADGIGAKEAEMTSIMTRAMEAREMVDVGSLTVTVFGNEVRVASDKAEAGVYDVLVVGFNPAEQIVKIGAGPNKRKKVAHRNVVTGMMKIGEWAGGSLTLEFPQTAEAGMEQVVLVQGVNGGPIAAATKV